MRKFTLLILFFAVAILGHSTFAQNTSEGKSGFIIMRNGEIVFATPTEVTPEVVKYIRTDATDGTIYTVKRGDVYAIVHSDKTKEIITPLPGQKADGTPQDSLANKHSKKDTLMYNLTHGLVRAGVGFVQNHGSVSTSGYSTSGPPGFLVGYAFKFNSSIMLGLQLAFNNFDYTSSEFSSYDQANITRQVSDRIIAPGVYARYNLMDRFIKPYILGGFSMNFYKLDSKSEVFFIDDQRGVSTSGKIHGAQLDLLLRAGVDLNLTSKFGAYGDIGFGTNLIQLGVFFNLK